jgi:hypothetical protein
MALDLASVGTRVGPLPRAYGWQDVALYALALGAGTDDLDYVLDPAPRVLPTWGVIPAFEPVFEAARRTGGDLVQLLHTGQRTELLRPFPPRGEMRTSARIAGIWDMKIGAAVQVDTETEVDGTPACRTSWQMLIRGAGGFGGERPPQSLRTRPPKDQAPAFEVEVPTARSQALLYRLTGDINPIHARPAPRLRRWRASTGRSCTACARTASAGAWRSRRSRATIRPASARSRRASARS